MKSRTYVQEVSNFSFWIDRKPKPERLLYARLSIFAYMCLYILEQLATPVRLNFRKGFMP